MVKNYFIKHHSVRVGAAFGYDIVNECADIALTAWEYNGLFALNTPCEVTGACADCKSEGCICNQILITRNSKPAGKIKMILVGEELGL